MLVRPGLELAASRSADRRLSNWAKNSLFADKINLDDGCQVTSSALASTKQQFELLPPIEGYLVTQVFHFGLVVNPAAALTFAIHFVS